MSSHDLLIIVLFIGILVSFTPFLGKWLASVLMGRQTWLSPVLGPVERCVYRMAGVDPTREMDWKKYLTAVLLFNAAGFLVLFLSLLCQKWLPLNPAGTENMRWDIALNTAISFVTNTNWQFYSGEGPEGVSYFVQMTGLGVQNFVSAGTGIAVMSALIRGLERRCASTLGNFWTDLTRSTLYFLVPVSTAFCFRQRFGAFHLSGSGGIAVEPCCLHARSTSGKSPETGVCTLRPGWNSGGKRSQRDDSERRAGYIVPDERDVIDRPGPENILAEKSSGISRCLGSASFSGYRGGFLIGFLSVWPNLLKNRDNKLVGVRYAAG